MEEDNLVYVEPKHFVKSKRVWTVFLTVLAFVAEYFTINYNMLGLSDKQNDLLLFSTGLLAAVCYLIVGLYTNSPIKGSPAHGSARRNSRNS